jgi:hypothetical protein
MKENNNHHHHGLLLTTTTIAILGIVLTVPGKGYNAFAEPTLTVTEKNCERLPEYLEARWEATGLPSDIEGFVLFLEDSDGNRYTVGGGGGGEPTIGDVGRTGGSFLVPINGDTGPYTLIFYEDNDLDTVPDEGDLD